MMTRVVAEAGIPTQVLVRPRGGDFILDAEELAEMLLDVELARRLGAAGVVIGALTPDATVDVPAMTRLIVAARPLSVTFHKAFDLLADPLTALDTLARLGVDRVLTSGGPSPARANLDQLRRSVVYAAGRLVVMAGGGIAEGDVPNLLDATGVEEVHLGSGVAGPAPTPDVFGSRPALIAVERVRRVVRLVKGPSGSDPVTGLCRDA
jgi:copper homeostasis protein